MCNVNTFYSVPTLVEFAEDAITYFVKTVVFILLCSCLYCYVLVSDHKFKWVEFHTMVCIKGPKDFVLCFSLLTKIITVLTQEKKKGGGLKENTIPNIRIDSKFLFVVGYKFSTEPNLLFSTTYCLMMLLNMMWSRKYQFSSPVSWISSRLFF